MGSVHILEWHIVFRIKGICEPDERSINVSRQIRDRGSY